MQQNFSEYFFEKENEVNESKDTYIHYVASDLNSDHKLND